MGHLKRLAESKQEDYEIARSFLCEVRCLEECENHYGIYFEGREPIETAYRIANARISSGEIKLARGETRRDYTDLLKSVYDDNAGINYCTACDKCANED